MKKNKILKQVGLMSLLCLSKAFAEPVYQGSSFNEVLSVINDVNFAPRTEVEQTEYSVYQSGKLPQYPVNARSIFANGSAALERDAQRTVSERFDYYDRLPKKLHPNGVCVSGQWKITEDTPYSGFFKKSSNGLFLGRISVAMEDTTSADSRGFGFAGKVFPTTNPNEVVDTGNFFTVDVLLGTDLAHVLDSKTTNEPETGFDLSLIGLGLKISSALKTADSNPGFRPLTQVASLGEKEKVVQPKWIRLSASKAHIRNDSPDFRDEVRQALVDNKNLVYFIEVSDTTKDRNDRSGWTRIGKITLNQAVVSYGCDRRLHFSHPKLN